MLQSMLDGHSQIKCFGEVFNPSYVQGFNNWAKRSLLRRTLQKYLRNYCIEIYLNNLSTITPRGDIKAIGFKVMYPGQFNRYPNFRYYLQEHEFKIIRLYRNNTLRKYVSTRIANKENLWSASENRGHKIKVKISIEDLLHYLSRMMIIKTSTDSLANEYQHLMVDYEKLVSNRESTLKNIFRFIGVDENKAEHIKPKTVKQNPGKLNMLIENYDEIREALAGSNFEWMLEE